MLFGLGNLFYGNLLTLPTPNPPHQQQHLTQHSLHPPRQRRRHPIRRSFPRPQYVFSFPPPPAPKKRPSRNVTPLQLFYMFVERVL